MLRISTIVLGLMVGLSLTNTASAAVDGAVASPARYDGNGGGTANPPPTPVTNATYWCRYVDWLTGKTWIDYQNGPCRYFSGSGILVESGQL